MFNLVKQRGFSLYDVEQFLKEAGAEKINENAVISLEQELEQTVKELVDEASFYANYAGRKAVIKRSDLALIQTKGGIMHSRVMYTHNVRKRVISHKRYKNRIVLRRVHA